jgi:hypothetical protein
MPHSIARLSALAPSHHSLSSVGCTIDITESDFRYTQALARDRYTTGRTSSSSRESASCSRGARRRPVKIAVLSLGGFRTPDVLRCTLQVLMGVNAYRSPARLEWLVVLKRGA